mgnify:FL=1
MILKNVFITNNTAEGLGGGFASCIHGQTVVNVANGAAIYDNVANKNANVKKPDDQSQNNTVVDGYNGWQNSTEFKNAAVDFFAYGTSGIGTNVGDKMLGRGDAKWSGYVYNGTTFVPAKVGEDGFIEAHNLIALTSKPDEMAKAGANALGAVIISGNKSATHGGGIGNNGQVVFGTE